MNKKKIFISYSHDSDEHSNLVKIIAGKLRVDGLDCQIDQDIVLFPEEGWRRWMENMIEWADFVIVICTPSYLASCRGENLEKRGATYEGAIISQIIYDHYGHNKNKKFIPVIPEEGSRDSVPPFLRDFTIFTLMRDYDSLLSDLNYTRSGDREPEDDCPYCGFHPFKEEDAEFFFGRETFVDDQLRPAIDK
ncbi:SEFIR domain-containing protein, partial [Nitrosomonas sp.]|uniref:SEFIR domain-containing protein n=1 Tax=Nitrosomonas sp. TaxID=42353 RepID=UPI001DCF22E1